MVPRKHGLIINISSLGGTNYIFNCAYGIGKVIISEKKNFKYILNYKLKITN